MEFLIAGALTAIIGAGVGGGLVNIGRGRQDKSLSSRLANLEQTVPELISRSEVQTAFQQAAQIQAQQIAQQQAAQQFSVQPPRAGAELNGQINEQLKGLDNRLRQVYSQFGLQG
jgi:hypothetical protein